MRLSLGQELRLVQKQVLAPRMIQSMEILQLPIMALQERIQQELQENPVLEEQRETKDDLGPDEGPSEFVEEVSDVNDPVKELVIDTNSDGEADFDRLEKLNQDWL